MKRKIKNRLIGWSILFMIIIAGMLCSCEVEKLKPCLNGVFYADGIELNFDNGNLTGKTKCNSLNGEYFTSRNYINFDIKGTKVYCINEYNIVYFRDVQKFEIKGCQLILKGNDFDIILNKGK